MPYREGGLVEMRKGRAVRMRGLAALIIAGLLTTAFATLAVPAWAAVPVKTACEIAAAERASFDASHPTGARAEAQLIHMLERVAKADGVPPKVRAAVKYLVGYYKALAAGKKVDRDRAIAAGAVFGEWDARACPLPGVTTPPATSNAAGSGTPPPGCASVVNAASSLMATFRSKFSDYDTWTDAPDFMTVAKAEMTPIANCGRTYALQVLAQTNLVGKTNQALSGIIDQLAP